MTIKDSKLRPRCGIRDRACAERWSLWFLLTASYFKTYRHP